MRGWFLNPKPEERGDFAVKVYSTNKVCQMCEVSRKQLRYYEEHGLLSPVPRNDANNYRYYTQQHLCAIVAAKALRNIDISLAEMKEIIYGSNLEAIQDSIRRQMTASREALEESILRYEQSTLEYTRLMEAISVLKAYHGASDVNPSYEVVERPAQSVVSLHYRTDWEDVDALDMEHLPLIQAKVQAAHAVVPSISALLYLTRGHFDPKSCTFNGEEHDFKIAIPVSQQQAHQDQFDQIPAFRGVCAIHIGSPKGEKLYQSYVGLLRWAREQGYELENWSVEEWLISPMITNNSDLWMIRFMIPFSGTKDPF